MLDIDEGEPSWVDFDNHQIREEPRNNNYQSNSNNDQRQLSNAEAEAALEELINDLNTNIHRIEEEGVNIHNNR